ncbi:MAG: hypothetical protein IT353_17195, partial [Gemmatimonadaceae bacterium]|nr:hypothetical protein [Gemmatimonadaceae bacterium]
MMAWRAHSRAMTGGLLLLVLSASAVYARTVVASYATWRAASPPVSPDSAPTSEAGTSDRAALAFPERVERDVQIRVWNEALAADPRSALVLGQLAALHAQRAREGGGEADVQRAERYARESLAQRTQRNGSTAVTLVNLLLAQHRYQEAYEEARTLQAREPDVPPYRALLGEVAMEIGAYEVATAMFDSSFAAGGHLSAAPRIARWYELQGHARAARRVMARARTDARSRGDVTRESKAWFSLRLADLELRAGRSRAAARVLREALQEEPNDPRLLAAMARGAASASRWNDVIRWGNRVVEQELDLSTLTLMATAYTAVGDTTQASSFAATVEALVMARAESEGLHRVGALFLLDHGRQASTILTVAQRDYTTRRDIYGADLVAWALHKTGQSVEAVPYMVNALRLHTRDNLLLD